MTIGTCRSPASANASAMPEIGPLPLIPSARSGKTFASRATPDDADAVQPRRDRAGDVRAVPVEGGVAVARVVVGARGSVVLTGRGAVHEVPAAGVVDVAIVVVVRLVRGLVVPEGVGAGLPRVRPVGPLQVGVGEGGAGVDDRDRLAAPGRHAPTRPARRCRRPVCRRTGRCCAAPTGPATSARCRRALAPWSAVRTVRLRVRLGVADPGLGLERVDRFDEPARLGAHDLRVGHAHVRDVGDPGIGAHVCAGRRREPRLAGDDDLAQPLRLQALKLGGAVLRRVGRGDRRDGQDERKQREDGCEISRLMRESACRPPAPLPAGHTARTYGHVAPVIGPGPSTLRPSAAMSDDRPIGRGRRRACFRCGATRRSPPPRRPRAPSRPPPPTGA